MSATPKLQSLNAVPSPEREALVNALKTDLEGPELGKLLQAQLARVQHVGAAVVPYGTGMRDFLGDDEPDENSSEDFVVNGLIPVGSPAAIAGPPKSRKTLAAIDIAVCVASGRPWLGHFEVRTGKVLMLLHEDTPRETRRRIWRLARGHGLDPRELDGELFVDSTTPFYFDEEKDVDRMHATLEAHKPRLVILDSLARMSRGDENSKKDMAIVTTTWADLCRVHGTTIAVIHHFGKGAGEDRGPGQRMRGTSDLFALVRGVMGIDPGKDGLSKVTTEGNLEHQAPQFGFTLTDGETAGGKKTLRLQHQGELEGLELTQVRAKILETLALGPLRFDQLRKVVAKKRDTVFEAAKQLEKEGLISREEGCLCLV